MSVSQAHSGKWGVVNGQSTVRNWNINDVQEAQTYVASNTRGGTGRQEGIRDWSGSFGRYGANPTLMPKDIFQFQGYTAPDDDVEGNPGTVYDGQAIVDSVVLTVNLAASEILSHVVNFSGDGELVTRDADPALTDLTLPDVPPVVNTKLEIETAPGSETFEEWQCFTQVVLTLTAANQPSVASCNVFNGKLYRTRKPGVVDWTMAITEEKTKRSSEAGNPIPNLADDLIYRLYIDATNYWELKWGHLENYSNITTDRETGAIISRVANVGMNGVRPAPAGVGHILKPGDPGPQWWPNILGTTTTTTTTTTT